MEALEPGRPLSFLDHRIVLGNSLLGTTPELIAAGIPADAFKPILGDDKKIVAELRKRNAKELAGQLALDIAAATADADARALAQTRSARSRGSTTARSPAFASSSGASSSCSARPSSQRARLAADVWCAAFVADKRAGAEPRSPRTRSSERSELARSLSDAESWRSSSGRARRTRSCTGTSRSRLCGSAAGSTSCSATRRGSASSSRRRSSSPPAPRDRSGAEQGRAGALIEALARGRPGAARRVRGRQARSRGRQPLHPLERALPAVRPRRRQHVRRLCRADARRSSRRAVGVGCIVPTGIATDDTTKHFFQDLVESRVARQPLRLREPRRTVPERSTAGTSSAC